MTTQCPVQITCDTGCAWTTQFNGSFTEAQRHFANYQITTETDDGQETVHTVTEVEQLAVGTS